MAGAQRVFKARIRSTQSLKKVFRAQELIAASRIGRARTLMHQSLPYARAITREVTAVASHANIDHPLVRERRDTDRVALLLVTADRGMAGSYTAGVIREGERRIAELTQAGRQVDLYVTGRRGLGYFQYRKRAVAGQWTGESDRPSVATADAIAKTLLEAFLAPAEEGGVSELHVVYNEFINMVVQRPRAIRMLPLAVVEQEVDSEEEATPLYDFEPSAQDVLDALLPRYVRTRIHSVLLQAAAAELAARQSAMHTATDNAEDLIRSYTRQANQARQGEITTELTEIVSGADALNAS